MNKGDNTKLEFREIGLRLWRVDPSYVTARRIAAELDIAHGTVGYHFARGERTLRDAIAFHAVEQGDRRVMAHLIIERHKAVSHMDDTARSQCLQEAAKDR
jgi:hypothetical protein